MWRLWQHSISGQIHTCNVLTVLAPSNINGEDGCPHLLHCAIGLAGRKSRFQEINRSGTTPWPKQQHDESSIAALLCDRTLFIRACRKHSKEYWNFPRLLRAQPQIIRVTVQGLPRERVQQWQLRTDPAVHLFAVCISGMSTNLPGTSRRVSVPRKRRHQSIDNNLSRGYKEIQREPFEQLRAIRVIHQRGDFVPVRKRQHIMWDNTPARIFGNPCKHRCIRASDKRMGSVRRKLLQQVTDHLWEAFMHSSVCGRQQPMLHASCKIHCLWHLLPARTTPGGCRLQAPDTVS